MSNILQQGAEAIISLSGNDIKKTRLSKTYRHPELDKKIIKQRNYDAKIEFDKIVCGEKNNPGYSFEDYCKNIYLYKNGLVIEHIRNSENKTEEIYQKEEYLYKNKILINYKKSYIESDSKEEKDFFYNNNGSLKEVDYYYYKKNEPKALSMKEIYKYSDLDRLKEILKYNKDGIIEKIEYNYFDNLLEQEIS